MSIAIWIIIALVCFVLPATALTQGGHRHPHRGQLAEYAQQVGLPLPETMVPAVTDRIKRRQRGMRLGGITGIVIATVMYIIFFNNDEGGAPALVFFLAGTGTALGGAWAIASHRPSPATNRLTVARPRSVTLADYLTKDERFGFWTVPIVLALGSLPGVLLLRQLPSTPGIPGAVTGTVLAAIALITWGIAYFALRKVLDAPARSASALELAWDDAERADGLRQVANLTVAVGVIALVFWLICIGEALVFDGFYREHEVFALTVTGSSLVFYGLLSAVVSWGPIAAWLTGRRKGYEQRQLWPTGVTT